jgi:diaminopimelate decarboxylase
VSFSDGPFLSLALVFSDLIGYILPFTMRRDISRQQINRQPPPGVFHHAHVTIFSGPSFPYRCRSCRTLRADLAEHYGTPFHIYDEAGILETGERLKKAFSGIDGFREYYAVKALPNPRILELMKELDFGFDCSSIPELIVSRQVGGKGEDIMFTSNNTTEEEFLYAAAEGGSILNLDDISLIDKVPEFPEVVCFRYNPGPRRTGNIIIGNPVEAKYGITHEQIISAYKMAMERGGKRFGLHTMVASNERDYTYMVETARMLLQISAWRWPGYPLQSSRQRARP